MKTLIRKILRNYGYDFVNYSTRSSSQARLQYCLEYLKVDLAIDVGANKGQFGKLLRELGFQGRIVSFEPLSSAHAILTDVSANDEHWEIHPRVALSDNDGELTINVSQNSQSSSALELKDAHKEYFPESVYVSTEKVPMRRLDALLKESILRNEKSIFLKVDVQGLEDKVLSGSRGILELVTGIQVELSMTPLYENELAYQDMIRFIDELGYELYALSPVVCEPKSGKVLQMDGQFIKKNKR